MGQKVNPLVLRYNISNEQTGQMPFFADYKNNFHKDKEVKDFIKNLLTQKAIKARSLYLFWSPNGLTVRGDLFFSPHRYADLKMDYAKTLFKDARLKYLKVLKFRDIRSLDEIVIPKVIGSQKKIKQIKFSRYYFRLNCIKQISALNSKKAVYGFTKKSKQNKSFNEICTKSLIDNVFTTQSIKLHPRNFVLRQKCHKSSGVSLEFLNKITMSLISFTGLSNVYLEFTSSQIAYSPYFRQFLRRNKVKQAFSFFLRNKELKPFVWEGIELFHFACQTYGGGNSSLIAIFLKNLFEKVRRQATVLRFLKFLMSYFFTTLPYSLRKIEGMRIILKGRVGKAPRTKKITLSFGQISLQTIKAPLDYSQIFAVTSNGAFGIKVFLSKSAQSTNYN